MQLISGVLMPLMLGCGGVYFLCSVGVKLFRRPRRLWHALSAGRGRGAARALAVALAGTLGVGNIAGVATAMVLGGAGAVFWMWVSALLAMLLKYAEVLLAVRSRRIGEGRYHGGAMYYIKECFGGGAGKWMATVFAVLCLVCAFTLGGVIQTSAAVGAAFKAFHVPPLAVGFAMGVGASLVLLGKRGELVERVCVALVPFVCVLFAVAALAVLILRREALPGAFAAIWKGAFSLQSGIAGGTGALVAGAIRYGVARGLISNEAGCGTAPIAHAAAEADLPAAQGVWGILEVFVDTILLCTLTALVILVSGVPLVGEDGVTLAMDAFGAVLGGLAPPVLAVSVLLFAFATLLCWSHYGAECLYYLTGKDRVRWMIPIVLSATVVGSVAAPAVLWELTDLVVALMTILNVTALLASRRTVIAETQVFLRML